MLDNAVKYSDPGRAVDLTLRTTGAEAEVTLRNLGAGIPPSDLPYVFNRFYRGREGPNGHASGTGLGLPIAKWIVDTHGGRIAVESGAQETLVTIHLPLIA